MLVLTIAKDLDELLQDGGLAAIALLRKPGRIMVVTIHASFVFVIAILRAEDCWTDRASKVLNVVLALQCCDVGAAKRATTSEAKKIESLEVIGLAEWILVRRLIGHREEFGGYYLVAVLSRLSVSYTQCIVACSDVRILTWQVKHSRW